MSAVRDPRRPPDGGYVTTQFVGTVGLSLVLLAVVANLIVFSYGRGAVRSAIDEGVRAGSRVDASVATCLQRARAALDDLAGGELGRRVRLRCGSTATGVQATADATFAGWFAAVPDDVFTLRAEAVREPPA